MPTVSVLGAGFECRHKPQVSASTMRDAQCALAIVLLVLSALYVAQPAVAEVSAGREVRITGDRTKQQFLAGYRVHIGANVADDVFAVGREVAIEGARARTVVTGAERIVVKDSVLHDLFAGGSLPGPYRSSAGFSLCLRCSADLVPLRQVYGRA